MVEPETTQQPVPILTAVSDTGPLISAFQSESLTLLAAVFPAVIIPPACAAELRQHGWEDKVETAVPLLRLVALSLEEERDAARFAAQIAAHPATSDRTAANHMGEAQAISLALRPALRARILLVDELAARAVATAAGVTISGFPGVLLLAVRRALITPEDLRARLETCRRQGTHYSRGLIEQVYEMAQDDRRLP